MCYKNGKEILPASLLKELQKYVQGEIIYIPKENNVRKAWGENNGTRKLIRQRNLEIYASYKSGDSITTLSDFYNLSDDSIRKIIFNINHESLKMAMDT
ncbi:hypothetical protein LGK97_09600 [Clostridium sp. CS001]|uniref:CD3324 family protein n=1 Tax=Clostridium sp. CS001 TaxID=2880648 RepID=UPI001CF51D0C|nr:CD3324 family protein [Clostridium sp. CS001]MCB2290021.1 hypothetical protein [Clostridium sp. CS001]